MIQLLRNKALTGILLFLTATGLLFYYREELSERFISRIVGYNFEYYLSPFMPLILLLLIAVNLGLIIALMKNENLQTSEKVKVASKHLLTFLVFGIVGWGIHFYSILDLLKNQGSMAVLEGNILLYHISDIALVLGFGLGAVLFMRKAIHHGKIDF
ncbi:hypothetical protein [Lishizhenia sp.]|uniref:hypothetical protein n=1 Tax=Lishizhenia sp. TaxID=2497594 RepID=UPI00299E9461|nr:hypothetical protein [Lishizhenia sp.]MDX1446308.1 hypothetical protein [Lishizhenia sp.]